MPFDFAAVASPFRMQPGLRRLTPGTPQLTPMQPGSRVLAEKLAVLRRHADDALLTVSGFDPRPAWQALSAHADAEHPAHWRDRAAALRRGAPEIDDLLAALPVALREAAALALAFEEDFAVVDGRDGTIPALAVCLPSHWSPREKLGRHFAEVHAPVADNALLLAAAPHLVRLVTGPERWERFVWTITTTGSLDMHPDRATKASWVDADDPATLAAQAWFRTERQSFVPLPEAQQAVFTIHVESRPLAEAIASAEAATKLHDALATMSTAVLAYRGLGPARDRLLRWLAAWR